MNNNLYNNLLSSNLDRNIILSSFPRLIFCESIPYKDNKNVLLDHLLHTTSLVTPKLHLRLAALLHDIGKLYCEYPYINHSSIGSFIVRDILLKNNLETGVIHQVFDLISNHSICLDMGNKSINKLSYNLRNVNKYDYIDLIRANNPNELIKINKLQSKLLGNSASDLNIDIKYILSLNLPIKSTLYKLSNIVNAYPFLNEEYILKGILNNNIKYNTINNEVTF